VRPAHRLRDRAALGAVLALGLALAAFAAAPKGGPKADRVFVNGIVWTGEEKPARVEALAVGNNTILAVGGTAEIQDLAGKGTDVVDLKGRFVVPGFTDAHLHLVGGSVALGEVDLDGAETLAEVQRRIAAFARSDPERKWITGRGWSYAVFPGGLPTRAQLDAAVPDRPVFLESYDGHTGWANGTALLAARINRMTAEPAGGTIVRDASGEPTGALKEAAQELVRRIVPALTPDEKERAVKKGLEKLAAQGLTGVGAASLNPEDLAVLDSIESQHVLKVRVYGALPMVKDPGAEHLASYAALRAKYAGPRLRVGAVKGFLDGVVESHTAAFFEPYPGGGTGDLRWTPEDLVRAVAAYDREKFQVWLHAIGDRAVDLALRAYEKAGSGGARRHRVEHLEVPRLQDLPRFKSLGVVASTQALFARPDKGTMDVYVPALGDRVSRAMPFKAIDDAGAVQAFGSDWPVYPPDVLAGIHCAVTRTTPEGTPAGGWQPAQRIGVEAALRHFTRDAAYACFDETARGTIAPGKLADLVVLSADITAVPAEAILKTKVLLTVMGGQDTYRAREF
jgi:predicted amidohydrolase YtcJ